MSVLTKLLLTFMVLCTLCRIYDNCNFVLVLEVPSASLFKVKAWLLFTLSVLKPVLHHRFWLSFAQVLLSHLRPSTLEAGGMNRVRSHTLQSSELFVLGQVPPKRGLLVLSRIHRQAGTGRKAGYKSIDVRVCAQFVLGLLSASSVSALQMRMWFP